MRKKKEEKNTLANNLALGVLILLVGVAIFSLSFSISSYITGKSLQIQDAVCDYNISSCSVSWEKDKVYCLNTSLSVSKECFNIDKDNVTLDCRNYNITGSKKEGIMINGRKDITIKNCNIRGFDYGIKLDKSDYNTLIDNTLNSNSVGIYLDSSENNRIDSNVIYKSTNEGILLDKSDDTKKSEGNDIVNNVLNLNDIGINIENSENNRIDGNIINKSANEGILLKSDDTKKSEGNDILNNVVSLNKKGINLFKSDKIDIINNTLIKNGIDFYSDYQSTSNVITNMTFVSSLYSTTASFVYSINKNGYLQVNSSLGKPGSPAGSISISKYLDIEASKATVYLDISYADTNLSGVTESTLKMYKYNNTASTWVPANTSSGINGVDTNAKVVYANITSFSTFGIFGFDTTAPNISISGPENSTYSSWNNIPLQFSADGPLDSCWYSLDGNITALPGCLNSSFSVSSDGSYVITVYANDSSGNTGSSTVYFTVDSSPPVINSVNITPSIPSESISITKNISDLSGVSGVAAVVKNSSGYIMGETPLSRVSGTNQSGIWYGEFNFSGMPDGTYTVEDNVTDINGNSKIEIEGSVLLDRTAPMFSMVSISGTFRKAGENVTVTASVNDSTSGVSDVKVRDETNSTDYNMPLISGNSSAGEEGTYQAEFAAVFPEGLHLLIISAADNAIPANVQSQNGSYTYDETPPVISNYPLTSWITNNPDIVISGTVTDHIGVASFKIDNNAVNFSISGDYSYPMTLIEGENIILEEAEDNAGNTANAIKNITLDSTLPVVSFIDSTEPGNAFVSRDWIYANVSVNELNEEEIIFDLYNETDLIDSAAYYNTTQREITWNTLPEGVYYYQVTVIDKATNTNSTEKRKITLDKTPPLIDLILPLNRSGSNNGDFAFEYSVDDANDMLWCILNLNNISNYAVMDNVTKNSVQEFNMSLPVGAYNWSINCTDMAMNSVLSDIRLVSSCRLTEFSGGTTDLSLLDVSNIPNLILDNPEYGKIKFLEPVDLSSGIDADSNVNISLNRIEINSSELPVLNKSAELELYNLTFANPLIFVDGAQCSYPRCTRLNYSKGILIFNVTSFTVYSAGEALPAQILVEEAKLSRDGKCLPKVTCGDWSECQPDSTQTRVCQNKDYGCRITETTETQSCTYVSPAPLPAPLPIQFPWITIISTLLAIASMIGLTVYLKRKKKKQ